MCYILQLSSSIIFHQGSVVREYDCSRLNSGSPKKYVHIVTPENCGHDLIRKGVFEDIINNLEITPDSPRGP